MDKRFLMVWLLTWVSAAGADFTYTEKFQWALWWPAPFTVTAVYRFQGDRMASQSVLLREGRAPEKTGSIVDLAGETISIIFYDKKECLRQTFQEAVADWAYDPPVKLTVSVDRTKETKTLNGVQAKLVKVTVDSDKPGERVPEFEAWLGAVPGCEPVWRFYERLDSKLPLNRRLALTGLLVLGAVNMNYLAEAHVREPALEGLPLWSALPMSGPGQEGRYTSEVLSWSSDPIDPSAMRVPEGFTSRIKVGSAQEAKLVRKVEPVYPPRALRERKQGTVRINVIIGKDGAVRVTTVHSGHPLLIPAAVEAVKQYAYRPTMLNGEPVEVVTQVDVTFKLP